MTVILIVLLCVLVGGAVGWLVIASEREERASRVRHLRKLEVRNDQIRRGLR